MTRLTQSILILAASLLFSSCNKLAYRVFFGVKKPKPKTETQVLEFLEKNNYSTDNLYGLNQIAHSQRVGTTQSSVGLFTTTELYNKAGFLVSAKDSTINDCWGKVYDFYKNIQDAERLKADSTKSVYADSLLIKGLVNLSGHPQPMFVTEDYDYTVVVYWASFLGKLSRQNIELARLIKLHNPSLKIQIIQINTDYRSSWSKQK